MLSCVTQASPFTSLGLHFDTCEVEGGHTHL